jgi:type I restriction enzyme R subunit
VAHDRRREHGPAGRSFNELETLVRGVLAPPYLLDYLRYFVLFEDDGRWSRRLRATTSSTRCVRPLRMWWRRRNSPPRCSGKGGVVWHTQGSGKSITMTCFAARVMQEPAMQNPTIVVITDRNDLDGQLFGVFSLAQDLLREQPVQATRGKRCGSCWPTGHRAALCLPRSRSSCPGRMRTPVPGAV